MRNTYKGCTFHPTSTTTGTVKMVFGEARPAIGYVWAVEGRRSKPACQRPFLTSAKACREWIASEDALSDACRDYLEAQDKE